MKKLTDDEKDNLRSFLEDLSNLTRRYKIQISGCGCCNSPCLDLLSHKNSDYTFRYIADPVGEHEMEQTISGQIFWTNRKDGNEIQFNIIVGSSWQNRTTGWLRVTVTSIEGDIIHATDSDALVQVNMPKHYFLLNFRPMSAKEVELTLDR